jgi:hypothetical protein
MSDSQHYGRRAERHVTALAAVILQLSRTDVEYIHHSLHRSLPATRRAMKRRLCEETVQQFLAAPGEKKTQEAFRDWRREEIAAGRHAMSEQRIRETLGAWDDAKAKVRGEAVLDPAVPRLRRSGRGIPVTPERARRALEQWVKDVPGGIRSDRAYEMWARDANDDLFDSDEPLHPVGAAPVRAAVGADDMAEAVREWDPDAASRPQAAKVSLNAKDHRPREWLIEDIERCYGHYERPIRRIDYRRWARAWSPEFEGEREPVSETTIVRRAGSFPLTAAVLGVGHLVISGHEGTRWSDERLAEFLGRVVARCVRERGHTAASTNHWWAEREAGGGPTLCVLKRHKSTARDLAVTLLEQHPQFLPDGVTIEQLKEDRR